MSYIYIKIYPPINSGSFGTTYYAKNIDDKRIYVIKEINLKRVSLGSLYIELDSLLHIKDNTCRNDILCLKEYYVDYEDQTFNIVTESFIKDDVFPLSLRQFLNVYTMRSDTDIITIMYKITNAIKHIHTIGIGHGDIKPENILINEKLDIQIIDFGLSCVRECRVGGTIIYESPEMLNVTRRGLRVVSNEFQKRSDIFSLGLMFYEIANGKLPYNIKDTNELIEVYNKNEIVSTYTNPYINQIINAMLTLNVENRPDINKIYDEFVELYISDKIIDFELEISPMDVWMRTRSNNINT